MNPLVSVIVPVYMVEQYVDRCITSIRNQSYKNLDIIVVNDGSPDNSLAICNQHALSDKRITIINQENKGLSAARNTGLQKARGEYVTFVDSDDWIAPNMIERMVHEIINSRAQICCCGHMKESRDQSIVCASSYCVLNGKAAASEWLRNRNIKMMAWAKLYGRALFNEERFFPEERWFEDTAVCWKLYTRSENVVVIPDCLYHYCIRTDSITGVHSPKSLRDRWYAFYDLYEGIKSIGPEFEKQALRICFSFIEFFKHGISAFSKEELVEIEPTYQAIVAFSRLHVRDCLRSKCNPIEKTCVILTAINNRFSTLLYRMVYAIYSVCKRRNPF